MLTLKARNALVERIAELILADMKSEEFERFTQGVGLSLEDAMGQQGSIVERVLGMRWRDYTQAS